MLTGILIIATVSLLGILSHRRSKLEQRIFKNIPLSDWIVMTMPVGLYFGWALIVRNIIDRPMIPIFPLDNFDILTISIIFMLYGFVGVGIHFTGKVLWRYIPKDEHSMIYRVNEVFHNKLGHYLAYLSALFTIFMLSILEINHPHVAKLTFIKIFLVVISGIIIGGSGAKSILYINEWFGGYNKPLFFITFILLGLILNLFRVLNLNFYYYPVKLLVVSIFASALTTFIIRQVLIYTKLSRKKRLKFLVKILSA